MQSLLDSGTGWGELNGISGYNFGYETEKLFLPAAGIRNFSGEVTVPNTQGWYWCSTVRDNNAHILHIANEHDIHVGSTRRAYGSSVRCVADQ